jgi:hypothetical protein
MRLKVGVIVYLSIIILWRDNALVVLVIVLSVGQALRRRLQVIWYERRKGLVGLERGKRR